MGEGDRGGVGSGVEFRREETGEFPIISHTVLAFPDYYLETTDCDNLTLDSADN